MSVTGQLEWRYEKETTYQLGDEWGGGGALLDVKGSRYLPPNVPLISSSLMFDLPEQLLNIRASWVDPGRPADGLPTGNDVTQPPQLLGGRWVMGTVWLDLEVSVFCPKLGSSRAG